MSDLVASRDGHSHQQWEMEESETVIQPVQEMANSSGNSHSRGLSESQNLLPNSPKKLFQYKSTKAIRWAGTEVLREHGELQREENGWDGVPQTLRKRRKEVWRDAMIDLVILGIALPFFALAGAVIYFNERNIRRHEQNVLDQCIKGVSSL